ncbi:MAG: hypothetical protein C5S38_08365 [Candidatus Methanophagaceae archaeon]|nr:MAG: hypothetical protein C5S38_08365 [Methanophagales archaeon]KAF5432252.1 hypothetical protein C5S36_08855 [Methanophagales archaeon]
MGKGLGGVRREYGRGLGVRFDNVIVMLYTGIRTFRKVIEMCKETKAKREEPIYEKLAPGEVLIISKEEDCVTYATNEAGKVVFKRASLTPVD